MLRLILVRHGETDWNVERRFQGQTDTPLNATGLEQAHRIARRLQDEPIDALISSDLARAQRTARVLADALDMDVQLDPRLRELAFGVVEGHTWDEANEKWPEMLSTWIDDRDQPPPGGETGSAFATRVGDLLADLRADGADDDRTLLLLGHGGSLRELIRLALEMPPAQRWSFALDNTAISELHIYAERCVLARLNDTCHLEDDSPG